MEQECRMPFWMDLLDNGKTLLIIYSWVPEKNMETLAERFEEVLGEPELVTSVEPSRNLYIVWPHQNMPEGWKEIAEAMTTKTLLNLLGMEWDIETWGQDQLD